MTEIIIVIVLVALNVVIWTGYIKLRITRERRERK